MTAMRYYEVRNHQQNQMEYFHSPTFTSMFQLTAMSERIWEESETGQVSYSKLRSAWLSDMAKVDMKEFMWVKLCSQPYRG